MLTSGDFRRIRELERILRRGADAPRPKYNKERIDSHRVEIQQIIHGLTATTPLAESSLEVARNQSRQSQSPTTSRSFHDSSFLCFDTPADGSLIQRALSPSVLPSLIQAVLSNDEGEIYSLLGDDPQIFADVIDRVRSPLAHRCQFWLDETDNDHPVHQVVEIPDLCSRVRKKLLKALYRKCGDHSTLPMAMYIPVIYDRMTAPLYRGGCGDVWKGKHCNREVAVKVLRTYSNSDLQKAMGVSSCRASRSHVEQLIELCVEVLQGSCHVESTSTPEYRTANRGDEVRELVCYDIGMDGRRGHQ